MSDDRTPTAVDDTREALAKMLDKHWFTTKRRDAGAREPGCKCGQRQAEDNHNARRHADHLADAILASPWLAAHVDAAVAEARGEVERLREEARRVDTSLFDDTMTLVSQRDAARADRDRLVEAVRGLADRYARRRDDAYEDERLLRTILERDIAPTVERIAWEKAESDLRALIAGTDDTTTRGTNQEDV